MKKIAIFGSTGSIGTSLLDIIRNDKKKFKIELLTANKNYKKLINQAKIFEVKNTALMTFHPQESLQSFSKLLRRIQILLIPTVSITSQQKCPIITRKPHLTPLKFTAFLANLVSIYSTPANLVKSPNPQFLTALLLYMGQILNQVSNQLANQIYL